MKNTAQSVYCIFRKTLTVSMQTREVSTADEKSASDDVHGAVHTIFWDVISCSQAERYQHFRWNCCLVRRVENGGSFLFSICTYLADNTASRHGTLILNYLSSWEVRSEYVQCILLYAVSAVRATSSAASRWLQLQILIHLISREKMRVCILLCILNRITRIHFFELDRLILERSSYF